MTLLALSRLKDMPISRLQQFISLPLQKENWKWFQNVRWMNEKASPNRAYIPTTIEHIANVITHGVWVFPSVLASLELIERARSWPQYWSAVVYGAALILLFTVSTFFHSVFYCNSNTIPVHILKFCLAAIGITTAGCTGLVGQYEGQQLKDMLHRGDRAMIYVFIAASYFPWLTIQPFPLSGWTAELWWIVWVLASLGILYQQLFHERYKCLETIFYLFMGITPSLAIISMHDFSGLTELKIGGVLYILGVVFFKADGKIPCAHAIWHLFVVMAAGVHYYAILNYLYPTVVSETSVP